MKRTLLVAAALFLAGLAQAQVAPAVPDQGEPITRFFLPSPSLDVVYAPGLHFDAAGRPERFVQQNADGTRTVMTWGYVGDAAEPATIRLDVLNGNVMETVGTYAMDGLAAEDPSRLKEFAEKMGGRLADKLPAKRASKPSAKCYPGDYNQSDLPVDWSQQMRGYATPEAIARAVPQASLAKPWAQQKCEASYGPGVVPYPPPPTPVTCSFSCTKVEHLVLTACAFSIYLPPPYEGLGPPCVIATMVWEEYCAWVCNQ